VFGISCYTKVDGVHTKIFTPSIGPIGKCVDDVVEITKCLSTKKVRKFDSLVPGIDFDNESFTHFLNKPKLRVGLIKNIGDIVTLGDEAMEAYETAKEAFVRDGHEIVEFEFRELFEFTMAGLDVLNNE
jgi:Asp-tRNA(Asn)/Glu-tRNA(Gln) amidotransferase A subunit family amidase